MNGYIGLEKIRLRMVFRALIFVLQELAQVRTRFYSPLKKRFPLRMPEVSHPSNSFATFLGAQILRHEDSLGKSTCGRWPKWQGWSVQEFVKRKRVTIANG